MRETPHPNWPNLECLRALEARGILCTADEPGLRAQVAELWQLGLIDAKVDRQGAAHYDRVEMVLAPKARKKPIDWNLNKEKESSD